MPGPYDIYEDKKSFSSSLPMGLGSSSFTSMWPDVLLIGGGALARRYASRSALGYGFMQKLTDIQSSNVKSLQDALLKRSRYALGKDSLARTFLKETTTEVVNSGGRGTFKRYLGSKSFFKAGGELAKKEELAAISRLRGKANIWQLGNTAKGIGTGLAAIQIAAMGADIGASLVEAAIDWRPRRDRQSPYEFGNVFYEPRGAFTQRQRAIMAIHDSQLTTRAAIGNEASFMHM